MTSDTLHPHRPKPLVVAALGFTAIIGYGSTYYLPAVLGAAIAADTGLSLNMVVGGLSLSLLTGGLASPALGRAVDRYGGRVVLALGSLAFGIGLAGLGLASNLTGYLLAWCVIGIGMGAALYDAIFAALGRWYGRAARAPITAVTLFGGLASTICWPLSAYLAVKFGWRSACFVYAAVHLLIAFPLHAWLVPPAAEVPAPTSEAIAARGFGRAAGTNRGILFLLVGLSLSIAAVVTSIIAVHLLKLLEARGHTVAAAVAIGTLLGPSQIAGRFVELAWGRLAHPLWSALLSATLMAAGTAALTFDLVLAAVAVVAYAAGAGVSFVVRGTLPLALFGSDGYGSLMGKLALPSLVAQAAAPWLAALLLTRHGSNAVLSAILILSLVQVAVIGGMFACRPPELRRPGRI